MEKNLLARTLGAGIASLALVGQASAGGFFEDSKADLRLRNFYYNNDVRNQSAPRFDEWGQAFMLDYRSGFTEGMVGFGVDVLGLYAVRLNDGGKSGKAGEDRTPGSVFPLETNGRADRAFSRVGVTGKIRFSKSLIQAGTLRPNLPVVIANDGRLLPQTYQGAQLTVKELDNVTFVGGKLDHSAERNSSNTDSLSIEGSNNARTGKFSNKFYYGGADYKVTKDLTLQYYYGNLRDFYTQHFVGLLHNWQLPVGSLKTDLRYFNSYSDGENSSASGRADGYRANGSWSTTSKNRWEVDNRLWSAMFTYSLAGHSAGLGYQKITGHSDFPHLNQGGGRVLYLITDSQIHKFHNAGEKSWVAKYNYDFGAIGVPGLKAGMQYVSGRGIDPANQVGSSHKEWERDTRVDYTFQDGWLKGLGLTYMWARWRGNDDGQRDQDETRLIANYSFPLF